MADRRYSTQRWRKLRAAAIQRDNNQCVTPGCTTNLNHQPAFVDHIHEIKDGGPFWNLNNLQTLCKPHHDAKTHTTRANRQNPKSPNA